jgi:YVTN family beta-propeller protein
VGEHPFAIGLSPDGTTLLALNVMSNDLSLIDLATRQPLARLKVGLAPYGVAFDAARRLAFVTNQHATTVSVIDLAARRVSATWAGGEYPEGIAFIPASAASAGAAPMAGMLLVVSWMDDCVHLVGAASGQRLATLATGSNPRGFGEMIWRRP